MRHTFPEFKIGGNDELTAYCVAARRLLICDNFVNGNKLTMEDRVRLDSPLTDGEKSFRAIDPAGITEALKYIRTA